MRLLEYVKSILAPSVTIRPLIFTAAWFQGCFSRIRLSSEEEGTGQVRTVLSWLFFPILSCFPQIVASLWLVPRKVKFDKIFFYLFFLLIFLRSRFLWFLSTLPENKVFHHETLMSMYMFPCVCVCVCV